QLATHPARAPVARHRDRPASPGGDVLVERSVRTGGQQEIRFHLLKRGERAFEFRQAGLRPVYARSFSWPDAPAGTLISRLKTPLRWSSVKRPWIISNAASGRPSGIFVSWPGAVATSQPRRR